MKASIFLRNYILRNIIIHYMSIFSVTHYARNAISNDICGCVPRFHLDLNKPLRTPQRHCRGRYENVPPTARTCNKISWNR